MGYFYPDGLHCVLHVDEESGLRAVRIPDSLFIRRARIQPGHDWSRSFPGAPDLAVEVISPGEDAASIQEKIDDYFTYDAEQVWVIYPEQRKLYQYNRDDPGLVRVYNETQTFTAESLFPGLTITLADLFKLELTD